MRTVADSAQEPWLLHLTLGKAKLLSSRGVNVFDAGTVLEKLLTDAGYLLEFAYALCQQEAEKRGLDEISFGERWTGDVLGTLQHALVEEVVDFFP